MPPSRTGGTEVPSRRAQIRQELGNQRFKRGNSPLTATLPKMTGPPRGFGGKVPPRTLAPSQGSVGQSYQPGLGKQLSNRVQSGRISQAQAQETAKQRQTLKAAFGSDWRTQVFGKGGAKGLEGQSFGRPAIAAKRTQALLRARKKLQGGVGPGTAA